jgi:hypothetical protein
MSLLPPVGWADVATKHDLDQTASLLDQKIEATHLRTVNTLTWRLLAVAAAVIGVILPFVA